MPNGHLHAELNTRGTESPFSFILTQCNPHPTISQSLRSTVMAKKPTVGEFARDEADSDHQSLQG